MTMAAAKGEDAVCQLRPLLLLPCIRKGAKMSAGLSLRKG